ncbi:MAG: T9SS type A sorting domain-containing protein [Bacteroidetes bacterium]|nr:MAG: T9SS type A sorting domain-containing protein [Bacteroidota bacterium]
MKKTILFSLAMAASLVSGAQKLGTIDSTFGTNGRTVKDVTGSAYNETITGSAVGPNGDIYVCGYTTTNVGADLFVAHYDANGQLDANFGNSGIFISDLSLGGDDFAGAVLRKANGKLMVTGSTAGNAYREPMLIQLNSNGSFDASFGTNGVVKYDLGIAATSGFIVERADGKIVMGGTFNNGSDHDFYALTVHPDGSRATGFGNNGFQNYGFAGKDESLVAMLTDANNRVLLGGSYKDQFTDKISMIMIDSTGNGASGFGLNGWVMVQEGSYFTYLSDLKFDASGNIVGAGWVKGGINNDVFIFRLLPSGLFDKNFDSDGKRQFGLKIGNPANEYLYSINIQNDGKIVAYGYYLENSIKYGLVIRFKSDGSSDQGFGGPYGYNLIPHADFNNTLSGNIIVRPSNERIIMVGRTKVNSDYDMMLVAIHGTEPFPASVKSNVNQSLKLYPNPAHEQFAVEADWTEGTLVLMDLNGKVISSWNEKLQTYSIPANLKQGVYVVRLQTATATFTSKMIIN